MKLLKGISFFVIYPILLLGLGFYGGVKASRFFYPGAGESSVVPQQHSAEQESAAESFAEEPVTVTDDSMDYGVASKEADKAEEASEEVLFVPETICVDTEYVLEETDVLNNTSVETIARLPDKYVGMNREQFLQAMEIYEMFPPLSELERGFVSLEVLSFSRERVVVQMNYEFVQPTAGFYLAVYDNEVIVYLEDMKTVYMETGIRLDTLPEDVQREIINMMWVEDEGKLYNFLEHYSS